MILACIVLIGFKGVTNRQTNEQIDGRTDGQTDRQIVTSTMAKTRKALHAVARKNRLVFQIVIYTSPGTVC